MSPTPQNALARETSPYLLQHAANPVDWHPWSPEALERAKAEDKPILLSVGYSACHWCHVMAHESFEDEETARLMNRLYVNIKVDREERPDLDKIYQISHQLLTRRPGGWPLTMFLSPEDRTPFFCGTYFPLEPRFGMPPFKEILVRVEEFYRANRRDIATQNASLIRALESLEPRPGVPIPITSRPLDEARRELARLFDPRHGGFGGAPKFPHCTNLELLLRRYAHSVIHGRADEPALEMVELTLAKMAAGGIYDHVGGGFCRYSVDGYWMIPHFEKMLYDNAPLLELCCAMWQIARDERFGRVAHETAEWVVREMQAPLGGYYSTLDADSEGEEGKYYVWTPEEVRALLTEDEYRVVAIRYGLDQPPNFENRHWHLHTFVDDARIADTTGLDRGAIERLWRCARVKLFQHRSQRIRPGLDDKILTAWNGLMIKGMAVAGRALGERSFTDSATRALDYIREHAWQDGRLLASSKDGDAHLAAYLDDYAFMIDGVLALLQARWSDADLNFALELAGVLLEHFEDPRDGGFYFTADDHESLIHRSKPMMDDSVPAGNGVAARSLGRLGHLLGESRFLDAAEKAIRLAWAGLDRAPHAHNAMLLAVEDYLDPPQTIVLRGSGEECRAWHERCARSYAPGRQSFAIPLDSSPPGLLAERAPRGDLVAYVCEGHQCGPPVTDFDELAAILAKSEVRRAAHA